MQKDMTQVSSASIFKRVLGLWPYLFITVSVVGLTCEAVYSYLSR